MWLLYNLYIRNLALLKFQTQRGESLLKFSLISIAKNAKLKIEKEEFQKKDFLENSEIIWNDYKVGAALNFHNFWSIPTVAHKLLSIFLKLFCLSCFLLGISVNFEEIFAKKTHFFRETLNYVLFIIFLSLVVIFSHFSDNNWIPR